MESPPEHTTPSLPPAIYGQQYAPVTLNTSGDPGPFQWNIAVSCLCSYFTMQVFTPILFSFRGPEEAGRMGVSLSITGYLPVVALCWIMPKAAPFGQLVRSGRLRELDAFFFRTLRQSLAVILLLVSALMTSISITREKELGTMETLLVSPLNPMQIIFGKVVPYLLLAFIN